MAEGQRGGCPCASSEGSRNTADRWLRRSMEMRAAEDAVRLLPRQGSLHARNLRPPLRLSLPGPRPPPSSRHSRRGLTALERS
jgi:hypothetical protein